MKRILCLLAMLIAGRFSYAQNSNPWPVSGNVGIGTNNPTLGNLQINGTADLLSLNATGTANAIQFNAYNNLDFRIIQRSNAPITLWTNTIERLRITADGNVGIGTYTPAFKFDVQNGNGSFYNNGNITQLNVGGLIGKTQIYLATSSDAGGHGIIQSVSVGGSSYGNTSINPYGGFVGIGTHAPAFMLDVQGGNVSAYNTGSATSIRAGSTAVGKTSIVMATTADANGYGVIESVAASGSAYANTIINPNGGNLGIGPSIPTARLTIGGSGNTLNPNNSGADIDYNGLKLLFQGYSGSVYDLGSIKMVQAKGAYLDAGDMVFSTAVASLSEKMRISAGGNVSIGTTDAKGYKLAVNGSMIATSVKVKAYADWPDYVFKENYRLRSLSEVKAYIDRHQHLPEVPDTTEVEQEGIDVAKMNKILLKKIEELTLYLLKEHSANQKLQTQVNQLTKKVASFTSK